MFQGSKSPIWDSSILENLVELCVISTFYNLASQVVLPKLMDRNSFLHLLPSDLN